MTVEELVLKITGDSKGGEDAAKRVGAALKSAFEDPQSALSKVGSMMTALGGSSTELQKKIAAQKQTINDLTAAMEKWGTVGQKALGSDLQQAKQGLAALEAELKATQQAATSSADAIQKQGNASEGAEKQNKSLATTLRETGAAMTKIGTILSAAVTAPIVGAGAAALKFGSEFETNMTRVQTLSGIAAGDVDRMRGEVLKLAPAVGVGPGALSEGLLVVTSTGMRGKEAMEILAASAKSTAIGLGETKDVARALTAAMTAYGKENLNAADAADKLFAAVREGGAEANTFATSLGRVIPIAAAMGVSFDEVLASIATFTRLGISTDLAVTGLRAVLVGLEAPTKKAGEAITALYGSVQNLRDAIAKQGLAAVLVDLMQRTKGNVDALREIFPNVRALTDALGTAKSQGQEYGAVLKSIQQSHGDLNAGMLETRKTFAQQWNEVKAEAEVVAVTLGTTLMPAFKRLIAVVRDDVIPAAQALVAWFDNLPPGAQTAAIAIAGVAAAMGPLLVVAGQILPAIASLITLFGAGGGLTGVAATAGAGIAAAGAALVAFATSPITLTVAGIAAVGGAIITLTGNWDNVKTAAAAAWEATKTGASESSGLLKDVTAIVRDELTVVWRAYKEKIAEAWAQQKAFFAWARENVPGVKRDIDVISEGWTNYTTRLSESFTQLGAYWTTFRDLIKGLRELEDIKAGVTSAPAGPAPAKPKTPSIWDVSPTSGLGLAAFTQAAKDATEAAMRLGTAVGNTTKPTKEAEAAAKKHAEALKALTDTITGGKLIATANLWVEAITKSNVPLSKMTKTVQDEVLKAMKDAIAVFDAAGQKVPDDILRINYQLIVLGETLKVVDGISAKTLENIGTRLGKLTIPGPDLPKLKVTDGLSGLQLPGFKVDSGFAAGAKQITADIKAAQKAAREAARGWTGDLKIMWGAIETLATLTSGSTAKIIGDIGSVVAALKAASQIKKQDGTAGKGGILTPFFDDDASAADKWAAAISAGVTIASGAMSVWQAASSAGTKSAGALNGALAGAKAGAAFGPYGMAIGAVAGAVVGMVRAMSAGRREVEAFAKSFGGFDQLHDQLLKSLGDIGEQFWITLTQKIKKGDKAGADALIAQIQAALANAPKSIADETAAAGYQTRADLDAVAKKAREVYEYMRDSGLYTADAIADAFKKMSEAQIAAMDDASRAAYDAAIKARDAAKQVLDELDGRIKSLQQSIDAEAPEEVMGAIEAQQRAELARLQAQRAEAQQNLDDANAQIQAAADAAVAAAADAAKQAGKATVDAIRDALAGATFRVKVTVDGLPGSVPGASTGALVTPRGLQALQYLRDGGPVFRAFGTDTVPAMLTPGEIVLNAAQQARVAAAMTASAQTRGGGDVHVHEGAINIDRPILRDIDSTRDLAREFAAELKNTWSPLGLW